jgi:IS5 family transposase
MRRQIFLDEMEATIPWDDFHELIRPVYHQRSAKGDRPPFPLEVMLRIHLLQQWFTLSDPLMEEMLIDTACFRRFAGIDIVSERIPDETTILNFRHLLEEHGIGAQIFETVKQMLKEQGALLQEGTILDTTIIHAPSSTKNKKGERDPEMHSVAKGNQWFFGMRCHIGVDAASGLVHSVVSTAANVHELNTAAERLHGEEKVVYGDSGHLGIEKREAFPNSACQFRIGMRSGRRCALPNTPEGRPEDLMETAKAHLRAKVEHPVRVIKCQFGFQETRYRGLKKNDHKLKILFALANLYRVRQRRPEGA